MIKKRYKNTLVQEWYERIVRNHMRTEDNYNGLTEEEADEKCFSEGKAFAPGNKTEQFVKFMNQLID